MKKKIIITSIIVFVFLLAGIYVFFQQESSPFDVQTENNSPVRIGIMTDIGYCSPHGFDSEEHLKLFLADMVDKNVDFQISLGDNAKHRSGDCSDSGDTDARFIVEKLRSNGVPSYFALGDHDIASDVESYQYWLETIGMDKTYQSFDVKDVHVVILDTVLGGDSMSPRCEETESCIRATNIVKSLRPGTEEYKQAESELEIIEQKIKETRSAGIRDIGRIGDEQINWLRSDIQNTDKEKVVIFSDHPLFPFTSDRKTYNAVNTDVVRNILRESGKQAVFISGEAHLWHEEVFEGFQFYIIDILDRGNGTWAIFEWDNNGFNLERVVR